MMPIENYKALSLVLTIFGVQPIDLGIGCGVLFLLNLFQAGLPVLAVAAILLFIIGRKAARRPHGYFASLLLFINTPRLNAVKRGDIPTYLEMLESSNA